MSFGDEHPKMCTLWTNLPRYSGQASRIQKSRWTYLYLNKPRGRWEKCSVMAPTMSKKRKIARPKDNVNDDVDDVLSVSTTDIQLRDEESDLDRQYYRRAKDDRTKLTRVVKIKSAANFILDPPECTARDCPYCKLCLMQQRFKLIQILRMLNTFLWDKLSDIEQLRKNPCACIDGDCTASDYPFSRDGPSLIQRCFVCTQRLHQLNCASWGEKKANHNHMVIDIKFDHDVLWTPV